MFLVWGIYNLFKNGLLRTLFTKFTFSEVGEAVTVGLSFLFCIVVSYLLGSINWALVISRLFYHDDVREHGSGNAGTTNILRSYGRKAAIFTFLGDGLKGVLSIVIACAVFGHPMEEKYYFLLVTAAYLSAFFCVVGHVFPCFAHFRGGKGFATTAFSILALNPFIFLILVVIFFPLVLGSHYVSLGSVITVLLYPVILAGFDRTVSHYGISTLLALMMAVLVTWAHRGNLKRIMNHTERKMFLGKKTPVASTPAETPSPAETEHVPGKKHPVSQKKLKRQKKNRS